MPDSIFDADHRMQSTQKIASVLCERVIWDCIAVFGVRIDICNCVCINAVYS
jgi:hypothetical protein